MIDELVLGASVFSGGRTTIPSEVMDLLNLKYTRQKRQKLLWTQEGGEIIVKKGTLQSSFRKTMLIGGGKTAVPKHIREALKLRTSLDGEKLSWIRRGNDVVVRRGTA